MPFLLRLFLCWSAVCAGILMSVATFSCFAHGFSRFLLAGAADTGGADFLAYLATVLFTIGTLFLAAWAVLQYGFGVPVTVQRVREAFFGKDEDEDEDEDEVYELTESGCANCPCHAPDDADLGSEEHLAQLDAELKKLEAKNASEEKSLG